MADFEFEKYMQDLVDLFIEMERSLKEYYEACAQKLPQHEDSWNMLINEEEKHARMFETIKEDLKRDINSWTRGKFRPQVLQVVINDVKLRKLEFLAGKISPKYALSFISDTENSLLESSLVDSFICSDPAVQTKVKKIQNETLAHRNLLQNIIQYHFK